MQMVPLNVFQQTQILWERHHPYNAAQFATFRISFSPERLQNTFNRAVRQIGLGRFERSGLDYGINRSDLQQIDVQCVNDLQLHLSEEMNRPFNTMAAFPIRPFFCQQQDECVVGLVYQHWTADSVSIRTVMRAWISHLLDRPDLMPGAIQPDQVGLFNRFSPACSQWSVVETFVRMTRFLRSMKRVGRIEKLTTDQSTSTIMTTLAPGTIPKLRARAKRCGATVGDLFMAAAAMTCAEHGANVMTRRRPDLAMGTIVDLRHRHRHLNDSVFGLFLGFLVSPFRIRDLPTFDAVVKQASRLRTMHERQHAAEASQLQMWMGLSVTRRMSTSDLLGFYRKRLPLAGGISNVNLNPTWVGTLSPDPILRYHRVSPTGPFMPIVFTPTTLGDQLTLCCTHKTALIQSDSANLILKSVVNRIENI